MGSPLILIKLLSWIAWIGHVSCNTFGPGLENLIADPFVPICRHNVATAISGNDKHPTSSHSVDLFEKNIFNFRSKYVYFCSFCLNPKLKIMLKTDLVYLVIQTNEMISILSLDFFRLKNSPGGLGSQHLLKIHFKFLFNFENFRDKMLNLFHKVSAAFPNRWWWCCVEATKVHFHKTSIYLRQDSK